MTVYQVVEKLSVHDARGQLISYQHPIDDKLYSTYDKAQEHIPESINDKHYEIKGIIVE